MTDRVSRELLTRDPFQQGSTQYPATRVPVRVPLPPPPQVVPIGPDKLIAVLQAILEIEDQRLQIELDKHDDGIVGFVSLQVPALEQVRFDQAVKSVQITNDDTSATIVYRVPDTNAGAWATLKAKETQIIGFDTPIIRAIGFKPSGTIPTGGAAVRVVTLR